MVGLNIGIFSLASSKQKSASNGWQSLKSLLLSHDNSHENSNNYANTHSCTKSSEAHKTMSNAELPYEDPELDTVVPATEYPFAAAVEPTVADARFDEESAAWMLD